MHYQTQSDTDPRLQVVAQFLRNTGFAKELESLHQALNDSSGQRAVGDLYQLSDAIEYHFEAVSADIHLVQCLGMKSNLGDVRADVSTIQTVRVLHQYLDLLILGHTLRALLEKDLGIRTIDDLFQLWSFAIDSFVNLLNHIKAEEASRGEITPEMEFVRLMLNCKYLIVQAIENATDDA